ncbi:hypothetical protein BJ322DRAFT_550952 [Thelephora terrestris]|uniref:DUF6533 domain-containing protein n=1 Tax=Thelephora terrestris TaxID=56493 RepID=A0A9P6HLF5_9AGAM|nr:hypothetical protein BJ322DRAFT_550952 [Thelephora terrestris]
MSSAAALQTLIDAGYDILSIKYYAAAGVTLLFYDYFLTLPDEIRYAWKGRKPWIFYIFLVNRYVPILYETWIVVVVWWPGFTYEVCNNTAWIEIAIFVFLTLLAQIFLTMRIYALTMKNKMIVAFFSGVTIPQLALGIYLTYLGATNPAVVLPPIPLDAFRLCVFARHRPIEIGYTSISLFFDSAAFFVIFSSGLRTGLGSSSVSSSRPSLVHTIVHDATIYFFVIFTSHLIFLSTLIFERVGTPSNLIYLCSSHPPFP